MDIDYAAWGGQIAQDTYTKISRYIRTAYYVTDAHLGEVTGAYLERPGKALRPILVAASALACGAKEPPLTACAAVEMFHTWTLMHDDIIDHDDFRRGRPTAHRRGTALGKSVMNLQGGNAAEYGIDLAILGGDTLHSMAVDMLLSIEKSPEIALSLARRMCNKLAPELLSGEQIDIRLSLTPWEKVPEQEIMNMMRLKTGALLAFCAEAGASIGENTPVSNSTLAPQLALFAHACGLAFQMKDDLLGVFGDAAAFGKPIGSDIREGKRTVLMMRTLEAATPAEHARLMEILEKGDATVEEVQQVREIIVHTGAREAVLQLSQHYIQQAMEILEAHKDQLSNISRLQDWADSMLNRNV